MAGTKEIFYQALKDTYILKSKGGGNILEIIIPVIGVLLFVIIRSIISRKRDKVDKDFRLSFRRKLIIITLTNLPLIVLLILAMVYFSDWGITTIVLLGLLCLIAFIIDVIYSYKKWKRLEKL